ncbi:MAG TPA: M15 family metallopeptidase [Thiolinea sp.]|nr:M15 family metallopeptidase [Thiolinea sp.]
MKKTLETIQQTLKADGYYTGKIDGDFGSRSRDALNAAIAVAKTPVVSISPPLPKPTDLKKLTTAQIVQKYGQPSNEGGYLVTIDLPYPMRISWDLPKTVTRMRVHKLAAERFKAVFNDLLEHYGLAEIQRLGIDLFGGCFAYRKMRGGSEWSRHSWGIAIDLDPVRNQLRETKKTARFARPEYKPMLDIFAKHGFINYGVAMDYDWMHFELGA